MALRNNSRSSFRVAQLATLCLLVLGAGCHASKSPDATRPRLLDIGCCRISCSEFTTRQEYLTDVLDCKTIADGCSYMFSKERCGAKAKPKR